MFHPYLGWVGVAIWRANSLVFLWMDWKCQSENHGKPQKTMLSKASGYGSGAKAILREGPVVTSCQVWRPWWRFPECVARVPISIWGSGGWGCVRSTLRLRSQPFATVRNRSQPFRSREDHMAVTMVSSAEGVLFGGFKCLVASFRVAGVALRDIQRCFLTCRKSFRVAGAILLRRFQKMRCSFRGRRSTLDVSIVIWRGGRSAFRRVVLHVFCESHW